MSSVKYMILVLFVAAVNSLLAQNNAITVTGKIVEEINEEPVPFATVLIRDSESNENITGTTSDEEGKFILQAASSKFSLEISFIGFENMIVSEFAIEGGEAKLGVIRLKKINTVLDEVELRAEKSSTEFKLDRRVFNVGKDLSSTGMGALELLNNVPSVNVSIEGEVSLRGSSGVQILIDGKPSIIADDPANTLSSITAEMIERIEVITNPSAKYDAEGTSGILNIVLKKDDKTGMNGSVTINTGIPDNHSIGFSLNRRTEKFNLFTQLGVGYRSLPRENENSNQDLVNNTTVNSTGTEYRNENFYNIILGSDYYINELNVITLSGNYAYEIEDQPSETNFSYFDSSGDLVSSWIREETTEATNPKWQFDLQFKREFEDSEDHLLLFSTQGRFFGKDQASEFEVTPTEGDLEFNDQQTETEFQQAEYIFKLDYTKPFSERITMELGSQYFISDVGNDYTVRNLIDGEWVTDPNLTNNFEFDQKVFGVYGTFAYEGDVWGFKGGLRLENTDLQTFLTDTEERNSQYYTDLFPSAHISYKLSDVTSFQLGYSSRIYRPRLWDLNPFFNIRNDFVIRKGNPYLQPEYTDSFELTSILVFEKISLNAGVYYIYTTDVIERVTTFEDNVSITTPENVGTNQRIGFEANFKYSPIKWFTLNGDFNYGYFKRLGEFEDQSFDFTGDQWTSRLTGKFKLPAQFELEIISNHRSSFQNIQSEISSVTFADLGLRKKISKGKLVLNFSIRDIFASRNREIMTSGDDFYVYSNSLRGRFVTLGLSYGFGKGEAMTYSGRRR
ncbi:TonB-dependent receptor domain-containing protein [Lutimonas zeaxanthinifaciens]|uniref:TonB-dependent receptor domain-containing protein n=1 Tax=Lutimonas zeaxanthinifaciens TaxID=3060215 RepID=UPI00265D02E4|nr:TonB-dependent receptor [Lutimonas sp. YSD2104]WKK65713.1 TonB-dependent receptor [Lutimonas sp. YSD2104]